MACAVGAAADAGEVQRIAPPVDVDGVERLLVNRAFLLDWQSAAPRRRSDDIVAICGVARLASSSASTPETARYRYRTSPRPPAPRCASCR